MGPLLAAHPFPTQSPPPGWTTKGSGNAYATVGRDDGRELGEWVSRGVGSEPEQGGEEEGVWGTLSGQWGSGARDHCEQLGLESGDQ